MTTSRVFAVVALVLFVLAALPVGLPQLTLLAIGLACFAASQVA